MDDSKVQNGSFISIISLIEDDFDAVVTSISVVDEANDGTADTAVESVGVVDADDTVVVDIVDPNVNNGSFPTTEGAVRNVNGDAEEP